MSSEANPDLDKIFEDILSEIKEGERDEAAMLQAIALSNNDPNQIRKNYLLVRSNKIHKKDLIEKKDSKKLADKERTKENYKSLRILLFWGGGLFALYIIGLIMNAL